MSFSARDTLKGTGGGGGGGGGGGRIVELPKEIIAKIHNKFYLGLEWNRRHAISNLSTFLNPMGKHYRGAAIINVASL